MQYKAEQFGEISNYISDFMVCNKMSENLASVHYSLYRAFKND